MWVTKRLISPVKIKIFCPKTTKIGIFVHFGPGLTGLFGALLVDWWLWRAGCISQDTYLLYLTNILLQFSKLKSVLEFPTQRVAEGLMDPTGFNSWAGRGVASSILPTAKENPFAARVKMLESKVASMEAWIQEVIEPDSNSDIETEEDIKTDLDNDSDGEAAKSFVAAKNQALEARMAAHEARFVELEQRTSFLVGLGLSLGVGLLLFNWMKKA